MIACILVRPGGEGNVLGLLADYDVAQSHGNGGGEIMISSLSLILV